MNTTLRTTKYGSQKDTYRQDQSKDEINQEDDQIRGSKTNDYRMQRRKAYHNSHQYGLADQPKNEVDKSKDRALYERRWVQQGIQKTEQQKALIAIQRLQYGVESLEKTIPYIGNEAEAAH